MRFLEEAPDDILDLRAEVPYTVTDEQEAAYQSPDPKGYVQVPTVMELLVICHDGPETLRHASTLVSFVKYPTLAIRASDIITNLRRQMRVAGNCIQSCVAQGGMRDLSYNIDGVDTEAPWTIYMHLEEDAAVTKTYAHQDGHRIQVQLKPDGKLLLPKLPGGMQLMFD